MMMPTGFKFSPTDEELIQILERKVYGEEMPLHDKFIVQRYVHELDPQDLEWDGSIALSNNERYCYYKRENDSREVVGRGWWRATGHIKKIYNINGSIVGYKRPLTFHMFMDKDRKRNKAIKTTWIMHEYSLESKATEWRICRIKYRGKCSTQKEYTSRNDFEASTSTTGLEPNFVGQEQPLQLDCVNETYYEPSITSMQMQHFSTVGEEQLQSKPLLQDNVFREPHYTHDMQPETIHEQQQQPQALFDDFTAYYFDDQLEQSFDSSGQAFPCFWSWQN